MGNDTSKSALTAKEYIRYLEVKIAQNKLNLKLINNIGIFIER